MATNKQRSRLDAVTLQVVEHVGERYKKLKKGDKLNDKMLKAVKMNRIDMDTVYTAHKCYELSARVYDRNSRNTVVISQRD